MGTLDGRVCVVTGASSGIGLETARGLAKKGATVLCVGRNPERTEGIAQTLREAGGDAHAYIADFGSLDAVRALADRLLAERPALHVLVHNAGLMHPGREESRDGYEDTFAVNHLAPFLLTARLRERLLASAPARVVTVSSRLHRKPAHFPFDDWQYTRRRYSAMGAYAESKLANVMFASELARQLEGTGVTSNSLHPGDVATNVVRQNRFLQWGLDHIAKYFVMTPEEGARTSVHVASAPALASVTGLYFRDMAPAPAHPDAADHAACRTLWELSERLTRG
ncbi:MAG: SDR family oxidoreductase [Sandaracinaceae bacterium]